MTATRTETDSFGPLEVPADKYWGAQTQRSLGNFKIGNETMPLPLIRALGIVKEGKTLCAGDVGLGIFTRTAGIEQQRALFFGPLQESLRSHFPFGHSHGHDHDHDYDDDLCHDDYYDFRPLVFVCLWSRAAQHAFAP